MKKLLYFLLLLLLILSACSPTPAYALDTVDVVYHVGEVTLPPQQVCTGEKVTLLSYYTLRSLSDTYGFSLTEGTVYGWRMGAADGPVAEDFIAETDVHLYLYEVETDKKCTVSYRYDYFDEQNFIEQTIEYPYGTEYTVPEKINDQPIGQNLYRTARYVATDNNQWNMPRYLTEDYTVYVQLLAPATITLDGETTAFSYGERLHEPEERENFSFVGYFYDAACTQGYDGVALNGLTLYTAWERVSYTVTAITDEGEEKIIIPLDEALQEDALPEGYYWSDENGEVIFPKQIDRDMVVFGSKTPLETATSESTERVKTLTKDETAAIIIVATAFFIIALFFLFHTFVKKSPNLEKIKKAIKNLYEKIFTAFVEKKEKKRMRKNSRHVPFKEKCNLFRVDEPYAMNNAFKKQRIHIGLLPKYKKAKNLLPEPIWEGHEGYVECYDYAWKIAFSNIKNPTIASRFKSQFIDTAFNGFSFMWDSSFMVMFGKYGVRAFDFQQTLNNFYACQHSDGFISRELWEKKEGEQFNSYDPSSTGPNILPWAEWEYYKNTGDVERLKKIFDPLMAYHIWLKKNRTWRDGSYWTTGLGSGMDNQPRTPQGYQAGPENGHAVWADACFQMIISANVLIDVAKVIGREDETLFLQKERDRLTTFVNEKLWNEEDAFYYDLWQDEDGKDVQNKVKTVGAYWALLAGVVPKEKLARFIAHLDNEKEFKRPNRVPSLSADHPMYDKETGRYWLGGVWAPTNYMVIRGLQAYGYHEMANEIARCCVENVVSVFKNTGTLWENYAPESAAKGDPAKSKFVGWSGLFPITILLEGIFGIEADALHDRATWRISCKETHGVRRYPLASGTADLICTFENDKPVVKINATFPAEVDVYYKGEFLYTAKNQSDKR